MNDEKETKKKKEFVACHSKQESTTRAYLKMTTFRQIKLIIMFLAALLNLHLLFRTARCHRHHFKQASPSLANTSRHQTFPVGSSAHFNSMLRAPPLAASAERRAAPPQQADDKMLVCYFTTRQAAAQISGREFVVPANADLFNSINTELVNVNQAKQAPFQPLIGGLKKPATSVNIKNQQQQLLFKSAAIQAPTPPNAPGGQQNIGRAPSGFATDNISQMLANGEHLPAANNNYHTSATILANKNKQTPAYSFIEELENGSANNGNSSAPALAPAPNQLQQGNNGNNFIISSGTGLVNNKDVGVNNGNHQERNPMKQQLVFSPSLSRAFIVNGANNELLDTKSQLFISSPAVAAAPASQLLNNHPQFGGAGANGQQLQQQLQLQKGKSLQFPAGAEKISAPLAQHQFSGAVSSAPPVPLSTASLMLQPATQRNHFSALIVPGAGSQSERNAFSKQFAIQQADAFAAPATQTTTPVAMMMMMNAAMPSNALASSSTPPVAAAAAASEQGAGSAPSPLSTMFDVFGAASQYLMRFKPSSLISPGSLAFNTISLNDHHNRNHNHHHHNQHHRYNQQQSNNKPNNSSSFAMPFSSAASALIPSIQKSSPNERSSSVNGAATGNSNAAAAASNSTASGGILSRFSLLSQNNHQRREEVCGRTIQTPQRRIIGGEGARYGEFPYQVHIKIAKHQCGGALVDKQSIVTAAHCVYHFITRAPVNKLQIVIGAYDIEDEQYQELPPQYFKVNKVKLHPNFRFSASHPDRYDIAILKLDKPVKYTDNVLPVCLPGKDLKFENSVGTVTGFGKTDPSLSNRYGTRLLQKVDVPIIENNECERWHRTRGIDLKIFPEMMCAGYEDGLKDACVGDSGGPLVVKTPAGANGSFRWTLAGITSAGFGCAQSRQPGIYHRVSHTVDWILENLD